MKLEARVEKLESQVAGIARRHVILKPVEQSDLDAIEAYGRDRIGDGEDVQFIEMIPLTKADARGWSNDCG